MHVDVYTYMEVEAFHFASLGVIYIIILVDRTVPSSRYYYFYLNPKYLLSRYSGVYRQI
jgi:hypothetical protein